MRDIWIEIQELVNVAAIPRKIYHLLVGYGLADGLIGGIDHWRLGCHGHLLGSGRHLENGICAHDIAAINQYSRDLGIAHSGIGDRDFIGS